MFHTSSDANLTASIPDPLFFTKPKTVTTVATGLVQNTLGINIQAVWTTHVSDNVDVALFLGPTILHVAQDIASVSVAAGTQNATGAAASESATSGKGGNIGADFRYRLTDRYSAGAFIRYAGGEVDLPSAPKLKVGGAQVGVGLRARF
jgi:hypothetical protein